MDPAPTKLSPIVDFALPIHLAWILHCQLVHSFREGLMASVDEVAKAAHLALANRCGRASDGKVGINSWIVTCTNAGDATRGSWPYY